MRLLADTHILLWQIEDDARLTQRYRALLDDTDNDVFVSDVSVWEVAIKIRAGKLRVRLEELESEIERNCYIRQAITRAHLTGLMDLPFLHRDPFDHLIIAQAIAEDMFMLTADVRFREYPVRIA